MNIIIVRPPAEVRIGQLHDVVILLQLPESSVCCFLVQIKPIVLLTSVELTNLNNKAKTKWTLVVVVKHRHRENGLFLAELQLVLIS